LLIDCTCEKFKNSIKSQEAYKSPNSSNKEIRIINFLLEEFIAYDYETKQKNTCKGQNEHMWKAISNFLSLAKN